MISPMMLDDFKKLPPNAQQEVVDFIAFLKDRYSNSQTVSKKNLHTPLAQDAFIGMWRLRDDLQDSSQWVRDLRRKEWT